MSFDYSTFNNFPKDKKTLEEAKELMKDQLYHTKSMVQKTHMIGYIAKV